MNHSTGRPTKAQAARIAAIKAWGCIACWLLGLVTRPCEAHHLLSGGVRRGHDYTIGLCPWHHRGEHPEIIGRGEAEFIRGPSLALSSRAFHEAFGSDDELLARQNEILRGAGIKVSMPSRKRKGATASPSKMLPRVVP